MSSPAARAKKRGLPTQVRMRHDNHFVDELTSRSESPVGKLVALSAIEPDPQQPRQSMGDLDELVASIREKGVLEPILVRQHAQASATEGGYLIISGERRYRAALEAGLYEIPVIEMDVSEDEALEIALIENLQRKDLTPFEEAEGYQSLANRYDYTHEEIASAVGKSRTAVTESLALLQMPPRARDAVLALGVSSKSILLEILKSGSEDNMIRLVERVSTLGLNRDDLRREVKREKAKPKRGRPKPYVFKYSSPDRNYRLSLSFRQSRVETDELIQTLERILADLKSGQGR